MLGLCKPKPDHTMLHSFGQLALSLSFSICKMGLIIVRLLWEDWILGSAWHMVTVALIEFAASLTVGEGEERGQGRAAL